MKTIRATILPLVLLTLAAGCSAPYLRTGDTLAHAGDWETALVQYRRAAEEHPESGDAAHKVKVASEKVMAIWTKRGNDANAEGRLGEAAEWWVKAVELAPDDAAAKKTDAWKAINASVSSLEYFGDVASNEGRYEEALAVYSAILKVHGERVDVVQKQLDAQKAFANELRDEAESLARRNLPGAALVAELRALQHDPLQQNAFAEGAELRKKLRSETRVAINEVKLDDHGYRALGQGVAAKLSAKLDEFPPYGPTKDPDAIRATFKATIVSFEKHENVVKGVDEIPNDEKPSNVPIPNPAITEQKKTIADLETKLASQQADLKATLPHAGRKQTDEQKRNGLAVARAIDATRAQLEQERAKLAALPPTVMPPPPPATWQLPWEETTRTVEATVRFELSEPDFPEPVVFEVTHKAAAVDRSHAGSAKHHVAADPLQLPSFEQLTAGLASQFDDGLQTIAQAKNRRVEKLLAQGRELRQKNADAEALDAFVEVVFLAGPSALPDDAAAFVAKALEHDRFKELVAVN